MEQELQLNLVEALKVQLQVFQQYHQQEVEVVEQVHLIQIMLEEPEDLVVEVVEDYILQLI